MSVYKLIHNELYKQDRRVRCTPVDPFFECTICFNQAGIVTHKPERYVKQLPCGHKFHVKCINTWLYRHINCPLCRQNVYDRCSLLPVERVFIWSDLVDSTHVNLVDFEILF